MLVQGFVGAPSYGSLHRTRRRALYLGTSITVLLSACTAVGLPQSASGSNVSIADREFPGTRPLQFRATEGTWMSLDVSPDGEHIVVDLLGDIYVIPIDGGRAERLTHGTAFNSQPRFSPDGRRLAFISDRGGSPNLWLMDRTGGHRRQLSRLLPCCFGAAISSPAWSPDGRAIVVSQRLAASRRGKGYSDNDLQWLLAVYDVDTGLSRWLGDTTPGHTRSLLGAAYSTDGATLYAAGRAERSSPYDLHYDWQIVRVDPRTGAVYPEMWVSSGRVGLRPAVSRDGRYLIYASSSGSHLGMRVRDLHTGRERWLQREALDDPPGFPGPARDGRDLVPGYAIAPDSRSLIAAYGGKIHRLDLQTGQAKIVPFVAEIDRRVRQAVIRQFSLPDSATRTRSVLQPALSPDGGQVAFSALNKIWIMELPRRGAPAKPPRRLTSDTAGEFYPYWSPDGRWIAYSTWADGEGGAVRRAFVTDETGMAGAPSERLSADTALYFNVAVSADGKRVVAVRGALSPDRLLTHSHYTRPDSLALVWLPSNGGRPRRVRDLDAAAAGRMLPAEQVYFTDDADRIYVGLTSYRWDGTEARATRVTMPSKLDSALLAGALGVMSPDRRRALVVHRFTLSEAKWLDHRQTVMSRWGTALAPWISWSQDGTRVLFVQGGTFFVGDVRADEWTTFTRLDVPLAVPRDHPDGVLVLHGARLITMRPAHGIPKVIDTGDIVVRDNRIAAVGPVGTVVIPKGATVIDVSGQTILPGYVDTHDHVAFPNGIHPQQSWQCFARLAFGVTAVRDPYPDARFYNDIFAYRERERAGRLTCPRLFTTGIAHLDSDRPIETPEDARAVLRPLVEYFDSETAKEYNSTATRQARRLLAAAAVELGLNMTIEGGQNTSRQLTAAIDGFAGLEHTIHQRVYGDVVALVAHSGLVHTQTFGALLGWNYMERRYGPSSRWPRMHRFTPPSARSSGWHPKSTHFVGAAPLENLCPVLSGAAQLTARGGRVAIGSHGHLPGIGFHYEMWLHALGGMPPHEVLRSATLVGATAIGHRGDFGSLEVGKLADLQILDHDPLADIRNTTSVRYVMKGGRLYRTVDLTQVWPHPTPLHPRYLSTTAGAERSQSMPRAASKGLWTDEPLNGRCAEK